MGLRYGIAEIAIAIGLQVPSLTKPASGIAVIMLCANVKAAREHMTLLQRPVMPVFPRLMLQMVFIGALVAVAWT